MDSDEARVAGAQGGSPSATTKKKQVGNFNPVCRSVASNIQEPGMTLPNQVHSPSPVWLYHSNWSDDLSPPHIIPCSPLNNHQSWLGLGNLGIANSRTEVSLISPEMPSPDIPNREFRPLGFGRGWGKSMWVPPGNSSLMPGHGQGIDQGLSNLTGLASRGQGL